MDIELLIKNIGISIMLAFIIILVLLSVFALAYLIFRFCPALIIIVLIGVIAGIIFTKKDIDLWEY